MKAYLRDQSCMLISNGLVLSIPWFLRAERPLTLTEANRSEVEANPFIRAPRTTAIQLWNISTVQNGQELIYTHLETASLLCLRPQLVSDHEDMHSAQSLQLVVLL